MNAILKFHFQKEKRKKNSSLLGLFLRFFIDFLNNGYDVIDR